MASETKTDLDGTDRRILAELQVDARLSHVELGRRVHLSAQAVARRIERLERQGVIAGYRAVVDPERVGRMLDVVVRLRAHYGRAEEALRAIEETPEVRECLRVTGADCYVVRLALRSVGELEAVTDRLHRYGVTETSVVLSSPVPWRPVEVS